MEPVYVIWTTFLKCPGKCVVVMVQSKSMNRPKFPQIRGRFSYMGFDNSPEYYNRAAESQVNDGFHEFARTLAALGLRVAHGKLRMYIPQSVKDLHGQPSVFGGLHRSKADIPDFVTITETAGFHNTRPLAKNEYFKKRRTSVPFHEWGAVSVDRDNPYHEGINKFGAAALAAGNSVMLFTGGTRVKTWHKDGSLTGMDTRVAEKPKKAAAYISIQNQVPLIPIVFAGLADNDKRRPLFLGKPVVAVLGDPIIPTLWTPEQEMADCALHMSDVLHNAQQSALNLAYIIRETI